jgi:hypothetical protein
MEGMHTAMKGTTINKRAKRYRSSHIICDSFDPLLHFFRMRNNRAGK